MGEGGFWNLSVLNDELSIIHSKPAILVGGRKTESPGGDGGSGGSGTFCGGDAGVYRNRARVQTGN